ncbi:hypothetical protein HYX58_04320 [Candidatus Dependentiae bacterium]|nr:hypothetical protein [Candidatus Dependentiae bacterium]
MPELDQKEEHTIHADDLLKLWQLLLCSFGASKGRHDAGNLFLERSFWHLGATITFQCTANPARPSWGTFSIFYGRCIKGDMIYYAYNQEFKKMLSYPIVHKELLQEGLITEISDRLPAFSSESIPALAAL